MVEYLRKGSNKSMDATFQIEPLETKLDTYTAIGGAFVYFPGRAASKNGRISIEGDNGVDFVGDIEMFEVYMEVSSCALFQ